MVQTYTIASESAKRADGRPMARRRRPRSTLTVRFSISLDVDIAGYCVERGYMPDAAIRAAITSAIHRAIFNDGVVVADASLLADRAWPSDD